MQETKLDNIGALAAALTLSGLSGSLKYLNLTNNKQTVEELTEACGPFTKLIKICKNLKVLRMNKIRAVDWLKQNAEGEATNDMNFAVWAF